MKQKGFIAIVVIVVIVIFIIMGVVGLALVGSSGQFNSGQLSKWSGGGAGGGCYLSDEGFRDTSIADNPDATIKALSEKSKNVANSADIQSKVRQILAKGKELGINPVVPLAIWNGEQGFANPHKAFGFGNKDSGTIQSTQNWDNQLKGVYGAIGDAMNNRGYYTDENPEVKKNNTTYTRLFYHYTTAMKLAYQQANFEWIESTVVRVSGCGSDGNCGTPHGDRMKIVRLLTPSLIHCASLSSGTCENTISKPLKLTTEYKNRIGEPKVIILHYTATTGSWTGDNGQGAYNYFQSCIDGKQFNDDGSPRKVFVQYFIDRDGKVFQLTDNNIKVNGAAGMNGGESVFNNKYGQGISINIENDGWFGKSNCINCQYTKAEVDANVSLIKCLMAKYNIPKSNIISHEYADILTGRKEKTDPGEAFMKEVLDKL